MAHSKAASILPAYTDEYVFLSSVSIDFRMFYSWDPLQQIRIVLQISLQMWYYRYSIWDPAEQMQGTGDSGKQKGLWIWDLHILMKTERLLWWM